MTHYLLYFLTVFFICDQSVVGQNVAIVTDPAGTPVDGQPGTFDYPILTSVTLVCLATAVDGSPVTVTSYSWTADNCYTISGGVDNPCFYSLPSATGQNITGMNLLAPSAGIVTCTATIDGMDYTSDPLTLRISGVALTGGTEGTIAGGMGDGTNFPSANNVLDDYTYILLDGSEANGAILFRCATGLGPSDTDSNDVIGDMYHNNMLLTDQICNGFVTPQGVGNPFRLPGVYQARVCGTLTTSTEGVYTCTLTNSSVMDQSVSIGAYLSGRTVPVITAAMSSSSLSAVDIVLGSNITLTCTSSGSPPDTFTWMKDGVPVTQSTDITTLNYTNTMAVFSSSYTISNVSISDNGIYTCTVTNPIGSDDYNFTVNIHQTNEGNEFFVGFIRNRFGRTDEPEMIPPVLWITTKESTPVNFDIFTIAGLLASNSTAPSQVTYIPIPLEFIVFDSSEDSMLDSRFKGIRIKAQDNRTIAVFGQHEEVASNDAYLALPVILLPAGRSYEYITASILGYAGTISQRKDSVALIIGTEDDTEIILEPSVPISSYPSQFIPGIPVQFRNITIKRFQTFYLQARGADISGTRIIANKPISVFSGHECANVPFTSEPCDMLIEQIQPIDTWGTEVVTIPLRTRRGGDIIKVFASQDSTTVSVTRTNIVNGTVTSDPSFILNRNDFEELYNIEDFSLIQSNYQIGVFQFSKSFLADDVVISDPFMLSVPSREQYRNSYVVAPAPFDPSIEGTVTGRVAYVNYTNIAVPAEYFNPSLITVNNNTINDSEFRPIKRADNSIWGYGAQLLLNEGAQVIRHQDPNAGLLVTMYGFSNQMSWGCTGGTGLAPVTLRTQNGSNVSDNSTSPWIIIGISVGIILLITIITVLLCLVVLRRRRLNKTLRIKEAKSKFIPLDNFSGGALNRNIPTISISTDEWKKQLQAYLIDYNSLDIIKKTIASGKFGVVYKGFYTSKDNKPVEVAVKTVKDFSSSTAEDFIKECNIAKKFDHPNVLSLIGVCIIPEESVPLMVMPYMHHGDVKSFLKSKRANNIKVEEYPLGLDEDMMTIMCLDIAKGMEYLSIRHYVHRDLAARNCMLDQSMTVKVADFGLSRDVYVTDYYTMSQSVPLPVKWLAPEALFDRTFSERTDVWAFGVTCWEMFSLGLQPYPLIGASEIGDYIKSGKILDKPQLSSDTMYEIMRSCWKFKPEERPDFSVVVKMIEHLIDVPQNIPTIRKSSAAYLPVYS